MIRRTLEDLASADYIARSEAMDIAGAQENREILATITEDTLVDNGRDNAPITFRALMKQHQDSDPTMTEEIALGRAFADLIFGRYTPVEQTKT